MSLERRQLVERVAEDMQRQLARRLAASRARVAQCEAQLAELESYRTGYREQLARRSGEQAGAEELQELQAFLARLDLAVHQQGEALRRARAESEAERRYWSAGQPGTAGPSAATAGAGKP
jgi:flagellar protein FliJ